MELLKAEDLIENARKAYLEGRLTAQHPNPTSEMGFRLASPSNNCACAVGASLPPELIERHADQSGLPRHLFNIFDLETNRVYSNLMEEHDSWFKARLRQIRNPGPDNEAAVKVCEQAFKELIQC